MYDLTNREVYYRIIDKARSTKGVFSLSREIEGNRILERVEVSGYLVAYSIENEDSGLVRYFYRSF